MKIMFLRKKYDSVFWNFGLRFCRSGFNYCGRRMMFNINIILFNSEFDIHI